MGDHPQCHAVQQTGGGDRYANRECTDDQHPLGAGKAAERDARRGYATDDPRGGKQQRDDPVRQRLDREQRQTRQQRGERMLAAVGQALRRWQWPGHNEQYRAH